MRARAREYKTLNRVGLQGGRDMQVDRVGVTYRNIDG